MASTRPLDGRLARSARTRAAILDALRELFVAGEARPPAAAIARRAGVSLRTVWQHFDDLQALWAEAGEREILRARAFVEPIDPTSPLAARITALVEQRGRMYEEVAPVWRAARAHEPSSPEVRAARRTLYQVGRDQLGEVFAAELARGGAPRRHALEVATAFPAWDALRADLGLPVAEAAAATTALVTGLLSG